MVCSITGIRNDSRPQELFCFGGIKGMPNPCKISRHMQRQVHQGQYSLWLIPCPKRESSAARLVTHQPDSQAWGHQHQSSASDHTARPANLAFGCRDSMIVIPALLLLLSASLYQESHWEKRKADCIYYVHLQTQLRVSFKSLLGPLQTLSHFSIVKIRMASWQTQSWI